MYTILQCHVISRGDNRGKINTVLPCLNWQYQTIKKVTIKRRMWVTGDINRCWYLVTLPRSPDTKKREREAKWLAGTPKRKWGSPPSAEVNSKKMSFLSRVRGRRTIAILLRVEDKRITETRGTPGSSSQWKKIEQSLFAHERKKILQWNTIEK